MTQEENEIAQLRAQVFKYREALEKIAGWAKERKLWGISLDHIEVEAAVTLRLPAPSTVLQVREKVAEAAIKEFMPALDAWESDYEKIVPEEYMAQAASSRSDLYIALHRFRTALDAAEKATKSQRRNKMKMPKTVYVRIENDGDGNAEYLVASTEPDGENGEKVGVYRLVEIKTRKIEESLI